MAQILYQYHRLDYRIVRYRYAMLFIDKLLEAYRYLLPILGTNSIQGNEQRHKTGNYRRLPIITIILRKKIHTKTQLAKTKLDVTLLREV
jgi:hypothetical protein